MSNYAHVAPYVRTSQRTAAGTGTFTDDDDAIISPGFDWTLPSAVNRNGREFELINSHASSNLNMNTTSSQTIQGQSAPLVVPPGASIRVKSDNANWWII